MATRRAQPHLAAWCLVALAAGRAWGVTVEPAVRVQVMGGQYFFSGDRGSLSGNAGFAVLPAVGLSERVRIFPLLSSSYQGTKQALDLVGTGTLFQEQMEHRAAVRAVIGGPRSRWRLRPSLGYVYELYRETRDERWGGGLFDNWRLSSGAEVEYVYREPFSLRGGVDYFYTAFPNYVSLESQAGADPFGAPLARELAGRRALNHHGLGLSAAGTLPAGRFALDGALRLQRATFPEQRLVDASGALGEASREDYLTRATLALRMPGELNTDRRLLGRVELSGAYNSSNQGSYDARRGAYQPKYYNWGELKAGVGCDAVVGDLRQPIVWSGNLSWWRRSYPHRRPQDATGLYRDGGLAQHTWLLSTSVKVPMDSRFSVVGSLQHGRATSNQDYEQAYAYNYTVSNYLVGVQYEY